MANNKHYLAVQRDTNYVYDVYTDEYSSFDKYGILISDAGYDISHPCNDNYRYISSRITEAIDDYDYDIREKNHSYYDCLTDIVVDYLGTIASDYDGKINNHTIHKIKAIFDDCLDNYVAESYVVAEVLSALTGRPFVEHCMIGCSQSDWIEYICDESVYSDKSRKYIEAEWMNTGICYNIYEIEPSEAEEIENAVFDDEFDEADYQDRLCTDIYMPYGFDLSEELNIASDDILIVNATSYTTTNTSYHIA